MCLLLVFFILKLSPQIKEGRKEGVGGRRKKGKEKGNEIKRKGKGKIRNALILGSC